ncbi:hypothetical protein [Absidia glauca]|uniref:SAM domain-containing protein n=1 Tax=Absidia glauca TaxID=4829 RepID=A0A168L052_ABSGL|nr:hypothetical protein [Absidia glauca]
MIPVDFRNSYAPIRPSSELLRSRRSIYSEHSEQLNSWYDDLQRYEKCLEDMASVTLDQNFKEELQHVDQWFCYLSDAERTATIYTLLQHSSPIQTRFFMNILQQQKRDSILTLSDQETSPFHQAEKEASQRLMNVIPYKTGHPKMGPPPPPPPPSSMTQAYNRHSIAFGDMEDNHHHLFPSPSNSSSLYGMAAGNSQQQQQQQQQLNVPHPTHSSNSLITPRTYAYPRSARSRPSSGIDIDSSPDFFSSWRSSVVGDRGSIIERSKSADLFNEENNESNISMASRDGGGGGFQPWGTSSSSSSLPFNDHNPSYSDKPLPRIATVTENDEETNHHLQQQPYHHHARLSTVNGGQSSNMAFASSHMKTSFATTSSQPSSSTTTVLSPASAFAKYYSQSTPSASSSTTTTTTSSPASPARQPHPYNHDHQIPTTTTTMDKNFGHFLDPKDAFVDDHDYLSDHSDTSHRSGKHKKTRSPSKQQQDKKTADDTNVDMDLLNDVPGWFRSLRLHKYNAIFEPMRWQDIIQLSDQDLQDKGVAALGARRKMIKVFQTVQDHCKTNDIPY